MQSWHFLFMWKEVSQMKVDVNLYIFQRAVWCFSMSFTRNESNRFSPISCNFPRHGFSIIFKVRGMSFCLVEWNLHWIRKLLLQHMKSIAAMGVSCWPIYYCAPQGSLRTLTTGILLTLKPPGCLPALWKPVTTKKISSQF